VSLDLVQFRTNLQWADEFIMLEHKYMCKKTAIYIFECLLFFFVFEFVVDDVAIWVYLYKVAHEKTGLPSRRPAWACARCSIL